MTSKIKELRMKLKLTQAEFAVKIGVAEYTVRRWEEGVTSPSPMARRVIKELFGIELNGIRK